MPPSAYTVRLLAFPPGVELTRTLPISCSCLFRRQLHYRFNYANRTSRRLPLFPCSSPRICIFAIPAVLHPLLCRKRFLEYCQQPSEKGEAIRRFQRRSAIHPHAADLKDLLCTHCRRLEPVPGRVSLTLKTARTHWSPHAFSSPGREHSALSALNAKHTCTTSPELYSSIAGDSAETHAFDASVLRHADAA